MAQPYRGAGGLSVVELKFNTCPGYQPKITALEQWKAGSLRHFMLKVFCVVLKTASCSVNRSNFLFILLTLFSICGDLTSMVCVIPIVKLLFNPPLKMWVLSFKNNSQNINEQWMFQINQQRSRTIAKNTSPEYASLLHFPGVDKNDLSKLHMHIAILGFSENYFWLRQELKCTHNVHVCVRLWSTSLSDLSQVSVS